MSNPTMHEVQRTIRELTCEMDTEAYVDFMRELGDWANTQADVADYAEDFNVEDE